MRNIDFNKYQSALIIGNGFDLSLGLSTSYMDFVNSDEFQILLNMPVSYTHLTLPTIRLV